MEANSKPADWSEMAVLFLHGFTASPGEIEPTARSLSSCGIKVVTPLLPGHGTFAQDLNRYGWKDWFQAVETELIKLSSQYEKVIVAGLSMGGLLALHAAARFPERVAGAVSINAPIWALSHRMNWLWRGCFLLPPLRCGVKKPDKGQAFPGRESYSVYPLAALRSMLVLRKLVMRECDSIAVPVAVIQSRLDERVAPRSGTWLTAKIPGADYLELASSTHLATMEAEKEKIVEAILRLIAKINRK